MAKSNFSSTTAVALALFWLGPMRLSSAALISDAKADYVASESALIQWQTSDAASSQVEYSTNATFANSLLTPLDPALVTSHFVDLIGLISDTAYYCRIRSGNDALPSATFKTLASAASTWPPHKGIGSTPVIEFSPDERIVSISYKSATDDIANHFTFYRPVVSDWNFTPQGKVYWVDGTTGSDSNPGGETSPLKTITKAIALVNAGDIVYVKAGTYVEPVVINKSGKRDKPITLSAAPGGLGIVRIMLPPAFVKDNPRSPVISLDSSVSNITINGFVIEGPKGTPEAPLEEGFSGNGISIFMQNPGIKILNNVIYSNVGGGIKPGISGGTADVVIEGNTIFGNGANGHGHGIYASRARALLKGNIVFNNAAHGIQSYSNADGTSNYQVIDRNLVLGNFYSGVLIAGENCRVLNNTIAFNQWGILYFRDGSKNNLVQHNVFGGNSIDNLMDDGGGSLGAPSGNFSDHNLYTSKRVISAAIVAMGSDEKEGNPSFIDSKSGDFRQAITSPYQDRGAYAPPRTSDIKVSGVLDQSAAISWSTDLPAESWIEYGPNPIRVVLTGGMAHSASLTGLLSGTTYSFKIATRDATGKIQHSSPQSFKTLAPLQLNLPFPTNRVEVNENSALTFTVSAAEPNVPAQKLTRLCPLHPA